MKSPTPTNAPRLKAYLTILTICLIAFTSLHSAAQKINGRRNKRPTIANTTPIHSDTITGNSANSAIAFYSYDKPLRSTREAVFVKNLTSDTITEISFTIGYFDISGHQIHTRQQRSTIYLPPGKMQLINFPAWDRQQSFFYINSTHPTRSKATPYDVKISTDTLWLHR